ncbi:MAG: hypothetical protein J7L50_00610 [Candidatus Odinarchaeota archaeon]|nr:hypothetical protein [Candidatus Odinarchaeota archaeon]
MGEFIKILLAFLLMSFLGVAMFQIFAVNPLIGLISLVVVSVLIIALFEPATAKATAKVLMPLIIIMFLYYLLVIPIQLTIFDIFMIALVLYFLFIVFAGAEGMASKSALVKSKVAIKLMPAYAIVMIVAMLSDPTGKLAALTISATILVLMGIYIVVLKNYDNWPAYRYIVGKVGVVEMDLTPRGKIRIGSEIWWAESIDGRKIEKGTKVVIVKVDGLTAYVKPLSRPSLREGSWNREER